MAGCYLWCGMDTCRLNVSQLHFPFLSSLQHKNRSNVDVKFSSLAQWTSAIQYNVLCTVQNIGFKFLLLLDFVTLYTCSSIFLLPTESYFKFSHCPTYSAVLIWCYTHFIDVTCVCFKGETN